MRKILLLLSLLFSLITSAQWPNYYSLDVQKDYVGEIEDMDPYEIQRMNEWRKKGVSDTLSLAYINAARAQDNLLMAPATIVNYSFDINEDGKLNVGVELINSTPINIAEARFTFEFLNKDGSNVYDIATGKRYQTLIFRNLSGRTASRLYSNIFSTILGTYHILTLQDAVDTTAFVNKKADRISLVKASFRYQNGKVSNNVAIFQGDGLFKNGPLKPFTKFLDIYDQSKETNDDTGDNSEKTFDVVEQMPSFPGGNGALMSYLSSNVRCPVSAQNNGIQGRVVVSFIVEKDGSISDAQVERSVDPSLDREALRVIRSMPRWNPGKKSGVPVRTRYNVPVSFRLP